MGQLFSIRRAGPGRLSTMAAPDGNEQLPVALSALKRQGVDVIVSMLAIREEARLGLAREERQALLVGLEFLRLPTRDLRAPDLDSTRALAADLRSRLADGKHVVVHCRGGIGRSSTLVAAILLEEGRSPEQAWEEIAAARGRPVPESNGQKRLLGRLQASESASPATR